MITYFVKSSGARADLKVELEPEPIFLGIGIKQHKFYLPVFFSVFGTKSRLLKLLFIKI